MLQAQLAEESQETLARDTERIQSEAAVALQTQEKAAKKLLEEEQRKSSSVRQSGSGSLFRGAR